MSADPSKRTAKKAERLGLCEALTAHTVLTPRQLENRDSNLRLAAEYRERLSWSITQLAALARKEAEHLVQIHEAMAYDLPIDSPIAMKRSTAGSRPSRQSLQLVNGSCSGTGRLR